MVLVSLMKDTFQDIYSSYLTNKINMLSNSNRSSETKLKIVKENL